METESIKLTAHKPLNPFIGKTFKIVTYNGNKELITEETKIESQLELKTILDEIKQFNDAQQDLLNMGYIRFALIKKLITE